jgi:DNA-binding response OmpR family regulator
MHKPRILYVEDDLSLSFVTQDSLELRGYHITHCLDGEEALRKFAAETFDLCILDVMLPKVDGFSIAKKIRDTNTQIPILFLSAKSLKEDKIKGLQIGADDYITKPYSIEELVLKIEIFLRRSQVAILPTTLLPITTLGIGQYVLDYPNQKLNYLNTQQNLTHREADLLKMLVENKNQIVKRDIILKNIWGEDDYFLGRSMDVFISRLRKYLQHDANLRIENIHGVGFRLTENQ